MLNELLGDFKKLQGKSHINECGTKLICETGKNDYLHVIYVPIAEDEKQLFQQEIVEKKKIKEIAVQEYLAFLEECNGCLLYGGSLVLFGCTQRVGREAFQVPSSVIRFTGLDAYAKGDSSLIYIGNAVYYDFGMVRFYLDGNVGEVLSVANGVVIKKWERFSVFLKQLISFYNPHYNNQGINIDYNDRSKGVYFNVQSLTKEIN